MADYFSKEKRSEIMSHIRSTNSKAETIVFKELRKRGVYFQKHYQRVSGRPDIALPRKKTAVFIDGDFWHGRKRDSDRLPEEYWQEKIAGNIVRDEATNKKLKDLGWKVLRVWESDIIRKRTRGDQIDRIIDFLN